MSGENNGLFASIGFGAACGLMGATAMYFKSQQDDNSRQQSKLDKIKEKKKRYLEKQLLEDFINGPSQNKTKKSKRRVQLCFDQNDNMVEQDDEEEEKQNDKKNQGDQLDVDQLKNKLGKLKKTQSLKQYNQQIIVNLGDDEYDVGKIQITQAIFEGESKTKNAELFIENLQRAQRRQVSPPKKSDSYDPRRSTTLRRSMSDEGKNPLKKEAKKAQVEKEDIIMDLNPQNFEKKDHIFMDFFSMYGKNFIDQKKEDSGVQKSRSHGEMQENNNGRETPFNQFYQQYSKQQQQQKKDKNQKM